MVTTDVAIIVGRSYQPYPTQQQLRIVSLNHEQSEISKVASYGSPLFWIRHRSILRSLDDVLTEMTDGKPFEAYLPSNRNYLMQYIATHPKCKALRLLEEGTMSYRSDIYKKSNPAFDKPMGKVMKYAKWLDHGGRSKYFMVPKQQGKVTIFGFHDALATELRGSELEVNLLPLQPDLANSEKPKYQLQTGAILFIMDALLERGLADAEQLKKALEPFLSSMKPGSAVCVKFHPAQTDTHILNEIFDQRGIEIHEIPSNKSIELLLINSDALRVIGFYSSLLLYAKLLGHNSMTLYPFLEQFSTNAASWRQQAMPAIFYDKVQLFNVSAFHEKSQCNLICL
jgi:hypothetical protein